MEKLGGGVTGFAWWMLFGATCVVCAARAASDLGLPTVQQLFTKHSFSDLASPWVGVKARARVKPVYTGTEKKHNPNGTFKGVSR